MAFEGRGLIAVLLHILLCSFFSFLTAEVESDISCLKSIKDSLEDPYDSLHTWDFKNESKIDICYNFSGVYCSGDDQVLWIELGSRGLKGQLPWGIMNCSSLIWLDLSNNSLSGHIPSHIFSMLPSLNHLDLSYNKFFGDIPASIGNLTDLYILDLSNNKFFGEIPESIGHLFRLNTLDLSYNKFLGEIPASIGNITVLHTLDLSNNKFYGKIPESIGNLFYLSTLDLSYNKFFSEIPESIGHLFNLNTLDLSYNKFFGEIPTSIGNLTGLYTLDLSNNKFLGEIPASIGNITVLHTLDVSNNKFFGKIPESIGNLFYLSTLDLSYNKFFSKIPESIGNLVLLKILKLNNNEFAGKIPPQLGRLLVLTEFSVANNLLSGPVPVFSTDVDVGKMESYLNNSGLCGGPLKPCDKFHQSFREGLIAGYVFSTTTVIIVYIWYFVPWTQLKKARGKKPHRVVGPYTSYIRRKREKEQQREENQMDKPHLHLPQKRYRSLLHLNLQEKRCQEITEDESLNYRISFEELCDATDSFGAESIIGVGMTGITYKARLPNGCFVAVKRLYDSQLLKRQFQVEIMILERYKHRNIVPLLGFFEEVERKERVLVYQYMPNGRLSDFLSMRNDDVALSWPMRVRIALGIARGLCWLHHTFRIVHFSMCSECILLDRNFESKISNFGEAKFINQNIGNDLNKSFYIENGSNNEFGFEKIDVYNFGTVLLELLAGKRFNPRTGSFIGNDGSVVVTGITSLSRSPSSFHEAIDKFLIGKGFDDEICTLLTIACYCIQPFLDQRPTMLEVYTKMSNIWERHELGDDFEMSKRSEVASATASRDKIVEIECM